MRRSDASIWPWTRSARSRFCDVKDRVLSYQVSVPPTPGGVPLLWRTIHTSARARLATSIRDASSSR